MSICSAGIIGYGAFVPEKVLTNFDLEKMVETSDTWIRERTGISERRIASDLDATSDMAARAALEALKDSGVAAEDIGLIIVATATSDMQFPSTACIVQKKIAAKNAAAYDVTAGCSGFVYSVITASKMVQAGAFENILVIGADTLSRITDWEDRNTCVLFGDGAGAVVISKVEDGYGLQGFDMGADGTGGELLKLPAGGSRLPASVSTVAERLHYTFMNGNEVYKFATRMVGNSTLRALKNAGLGVSDVDLFFPHQANLRIIEVAAKRLKLPMEKVLLNVHKYGNTSNASIPMLLCETKSEGKLPDDKLIVLVGFGAGLTWAACVLRTGGRCKRKAD